MVPEDTAHPRQSLAWVQKLNIEVQLAVLAVKQRVALNDPRIEEARNDALIYIAGGANPKEAVDLAAVHAFKIREDCLDRLKKVRRLDDRG